MELDQIPALPFDLADMSLGEIAVRLPGATAVFHAAKLDYCCHGQARLKDAAEAAFLDLARIIADLTKLQQADSGPSVDIDSAALVDTIITRYHRVHSKELPELIRLAERVEQVQHEHPAVPAGLAVLLKRMLGELTIHMQKEELMLFPQMRRGGRLRHHDPIMAMIAEHEEHGADLQRIRQLTRDMRTPDDGCATWRALYAGLGKFADDLVAHIHMENNILFPSFMGNVG
ncbi:MAG TPA: iron-sulfur cluster repair di-iron protein [Sphingobium sp.]|nr:iron-sulfur cluster repair di-iron protein [Sphingobium sp.]